MKTLAALAFVVLFCSLSSAAEKTPAAPVVKAPEERLLGKWREELEFGGDPNRPVEKRPTLVFSKGTYVHTFPATSGAPMEGTWKVASAKGDELVLKQTLKLDAKTSFPVDDQKVLFKDADTFELRNAKNGHGGLYKRVK